MSTAVPLHELPDQAAAEEMARVRKEEALRHFDAILKAAAMESTSSLRIGFHAHVMKRDGLFQMLGFEHEEEARRKSGVGKSTWFNCIRIAEAYNTLEEEQFVSMKLLNAQAAMDLPESKRLSREWIRMAGSMSTEDFAAKVDEELQGKARQSDGKERGTVLKMPMPVSREKNVREGLEDYAEKIGIPKSDISRSLEMLVIEKTGEVSLIGAITSAAARIRVAKELRNSGLSAEEALDKVMNLLDEMALDFHNALNVVHAEGIVN